MFPISLFLRPHSGFFFQKKRYDDAGREEQKNMYV